MRKKLLSIILTMCLCLTVLSTGVAAEAVIVNDPFGAPVITTAYYDVETTVLTATLTTNDLDSRYFESYVLTNEELENAMGHFTIDSVVYSILGLMSYNADDTQHVKIDREKGEVTLSQEQYFGENELPVVGQKVFIAVQTEGYHLPDEWGEGSALSAPWTLTVPPIPAPLPMKNLNVTVKSIVEDGTIMLDGFGPMTGRVATLSVMFDKQYGLNHFFVTPLRLSDHSKIATTHMPFLTVGNGAIGWEGSDSNNQNDEIITQTPQTLTAEIKVLQLPSGGFMGYSPGENIVIGAATENPYTPEQSEMTYVEIPFDKSSVGKTFTAEVSEPLENTSTISAEEIVKGESVTVNASAKGGEGEKQFTVLYQKSGDTNWKTVSPYSDTTTVKVKPASTGKYKIVVKTRDGSGTVARKAFTIKVNNVLSNTSLISAEEIVKGGSVTVNASAEGGMGENQFTVLYQKAGDTSWKTVTQYSDKTTVNVKPASTGYYKIVVKVKDKSGTIARKAFTVKVNPALTNTSTIDAESVVKGGFFTVNASAEGGMGDNQYTVLYQKIGDTKWKTVSEYSTVTTVKIKPASASDYKIVVKAKDKSGTIARKAFSVKVVLPE